MCAPVKVTQGGLCSCVPCKMQKSGEGSPPVAGALSDETPGNASNPAGKLPGRSPGGTPGKNPTSPLKMEGGREALHGPVKDQISKQNTHNRFVVTAVPAEMLLMAWNLLFPINPPRQ